MKLNLVCTGEGFRVADDSDYEQKRKLKRGRVYECTVKEFRNYRFHKLYFALISTAWEFLDERQQAFFKDDAEAFRKCVEVSAGHFDLVYSLSRREWMETPRSIAFDRLTEAEFSDLYERVKKVLYDIFLTSVNKEIFEQQLKWF